MPKRIVGPMTSEVLYVSISLSFYVYNVHSMIWFIMASIYCITYVYVCQCMYIYIHMCVYTVCDIDVYLQTCIYVYMCKCLQVYYVYVYIYINTFCRILHHISSIRWACDRSVTWNLRLGCSEWYPQWCNWRDSRQEFASRHFSILPAIKHPRRQLASE